MVGIRIGKHDGAILDRGTRPQIIIDALALGLVADFRLANEQRLARERFEDHRRPGGKREAKPVRLAILHPQPGRQRLRSPIAIIIE